MATIQKTLGSSHKTMDKLEKALHEAHEDLKVNQDKLDMAQPEKIYLNKKIIEVNYSITKSSFENALNKVGSFIPS